jgi:uncharacterized protein YbjQ (UPF0145 family)
MFELFFVVLLVACGYFIGGNIERGHYRSIAKREESTVHIPTSSRKTVESEDEARVVEATLAYGSVVISIDRFKRLLAGLRNIFGGEVSSYASLIDRARREAFLRMKESHPKADYFVNCRLETAALSNGQGKQVGTVEVLAYGTAIYLSK